MPVRPYITVPSFRTPRYFLELLNTIAISLSSSNLPLIGFCHLKILLPFLQKDFVKTMICISVHTSIPDSLHFLIVLVIIFLPIAAVASATGRQYNGNISAPITP